MSGNMRIFISHAARDKAAVSRLERTLSQWGVRPWVDQQALAGGQQWSAELQRAIAQSAALVLVVTPAALASDMVRREYRTALELRIPVIPLMLRPVSGLPAELASLAQIDCMRKRWLGEEQLFLALYDQGIRPEEHSNVLGSQWPVNVLLSNEGRAPESWQRYTVARKVYAALGMLYAFVGVVVCVPITAISIALLVTSMLLDSGQGSSIATHTFAVIAVPFALITGVIGQVLTQVPALAFVSYYFGWWSPEAVVVTDTSVSTNLFRFRWARAGVESRHYPFAAMQTIEQRRTLLGSVVLTMRARDTGVITTMRLPRRLTDVRALATWICDATHAYQADHQHGAVETPTFLQAPGQPHTANVQASSLASVPARVPHYVVLAGLNDLPLLTTVQSSLAWRGVHMAEWVRLPPPEALIMPTAAGAMQAGFALVFLSKAVLRSARLQPIVSDLVARGILIIPVVVSAKLPKPAILTQFQWVDFSARVDRRRSLCDLLNALDAAGVSLVPPPQALDGDFTLARAMHERPLPDWQVFRVHPQARTVYRIYQVVRAVRPAGAVARALIAVILPSVAIALISPLLGNGFSPQSPQMILAYVALSLATFVALMAAAAVPYIASGLWTQLLRGAVIPEMIVITPSAVVVHVVDVRANRFDDYVLPFAAIQTIKRRRGYYTPLRLHCTLRDGGAIEFGLPGYLVDVDVAAATIEQRWYGWQTDHRLPAPAHLSASS